MFDASGVPQIGSPKQHEYLCALAEQAGFSRFSEAIALQLAVPPAQWQELKALCDSEHVEATAIGRFVATGRLTLRFQGEIVGDQR